MWRNENGSRYNSSKLRHANDLTDAEWALVGPLILPANRGGNKHTVHLQMDTRAAEEVSSA